MQFSLLLIFIPLQYMCSPDPPYVKLEFSAMPSTTYFLKLSSIPLLNPYNICTFTLYDRLSLQLTTILYNFLNYT